MNYPIAPVPVFRTPLQPVVEPEWDGCDDCGSTTDLHLYGFMILCPLCGDVGGASDLPYGGGAA